MTKQKLNDHNYRDLSKTAQIYLMSISQYHHLTDDPPSDGTHKDTLCDDAHISYQIQNSIDIEVLGLVNHCENMKDLVEILNFLY